MCAVSAFASVQALLSPDTRVDIRPSKELMQENHMHVGLSLRIATVAQNRPQTVGSRSFDPRKPAHTSSGEPLCNSVSLDIGGLEVLAQHNEQPVEDCPPLNQLLSLHTHWPLSSQMPKHPQMWP